MPSVVGEITKGAVFPTLVAGDAVSFTPAVLADWTGSADPGQMDDAADQLAARVTSHVANVSNPHAVTAAQAGAQPVDATLTALAGLTITQGSLITGTGADAFAVLPKGTASQVLTMNAGATAPEWAAAAGGTPTAITVADEAVDTTSFPLFVTAPTGDLGPKTNAGLAFNAATGVLTATGFSGPLTGNVTGNASGSSGSCTGNAATVTTNANLTGPVTSTGNATAIADNTLAVTKLAATQTDVFFGRDTVAAGAGEEITVAAAKTLLGLTGTNSGDQTISLTGDVTGSGTGSFAATIANDAVTYAKMQNVSATDKVLGRSTAGAGDVEEIACTAQGRALIAGADAAAQRTTLGLAAVASSGSAADLSAGILADARMPNLTGDVTTVEGAVATTLADKRKRFTHSWHLNGSSLMVGAEYAVALGPDAATILRVTSETDTGSVDFDIEIRALGSGETTGTAITTSDMTADDDGTITTSFVAGAANIAADSWLVLIPRVLTTTPNDLKVCVSGTVD